MAFASATTTNDTMLAGFTIPQGAANPYAWVQEQLVAQMYPPWAKGYRARYITLLTVLAANVALSLLYMTVYSLDLRRKGRQVWSWRIVQRPAGRYLILNQYISYPICSIVLSIMWIVYTMHLWDLFGTDSHADPNSLFFFIPLSWIPYFISSWATTFAVLSAANLASKGRKPNTHRLSPLLANTLLLALPLAMVIAITCAGVWTGIKWKQFAESWTLVYREMGLAAEEWNGSSTQARIDELNNLIIARMSRFCDFRTSQRICAAIYCISAAVLIVINVTGGVSLLATLRALGRHDDRIIVPRNEPLVAPLQPFTTGPSALDTTGMPETIFINFEEVKEEGGAGPNVAADLSRGDRGRDVWEQESVAAGLKRLEWDMVLFFVAVVPSCLLFIIFSAWMANNLDRVFVSPELYEFSTQGLIFIFSCTSFLSLLSLTLKTSLSLLSSRSHRRRQLKDDTIEANLRRRAARDRARAGARGQFAGVKIEEYKEVHSEAGSLSDIEAFRGTWSGLSSSPPRALLSTAGQKL